MVKRLKRLFKTNPGLYKFMTVAVAIHLTMTSLQSFFIEPSILYDITDFIEDEYIAKDQDIQIVS